MGSLPGKLKTLTLVLLIVASVLLTCPIAHSQEAMVTVFSASDPLGDDKGTGAYTYPTNAVFKPGVFDLTGFKVLKNSTHVALAVFLRNLGGNPWGGPAGFCLQHIQVYIRTAASGTVNTSTYGLKVRIADEYAWHYAILLTPGWGEDPAPTGQVSAIYDATGALVTKATEPNFKVYTDPALNAVVAVIDVSLLSNVANIANWKYVVTVSGYDGYESSKIRVVTITTEEWKFGGADTYAMAAGIAPQVIDLLVPTAEAQYAMLSSFTVNKETLKGTLAVVSGVPAPAPQPVTVTETATRTTTQTKTETATRTATLTTTETATKTSTVTAATTLPTTITKTTTITDWTTTAAVGIILLVIGLLLGYVFLRRR